MNSLVSCAPRENLSGTFGRLSNNQRLPIARLFRAPRMVTCNLRPTNLFVFCTVHGSKGLEFRAVHMLDCENIKKSPLARHIAYTGSRAPKHHSISTTLILCLDIYQAHSPF